MVAHVHADPPAGASHANLFAHLSGPFTGAAAQTILSLDPSGSAVVDFAARLPLLLIAPRSPLGAQGMTVTVHVVPTAGPAPTGVQVTFAPWTEAGASVLAWVPAAGNMAGDRAVAFTVTVSISGIELASPADLVDVILVEGNLGRLLYVMGAEKMRLRRQAAELLAARRLENAAGNALDRAGADLGVPRLDARLGWDTTLSTPTIVPEREPDEAYRARMASYRRLVRPTRAAVDAMVAATGATIAEPDTELLVAVRLVGPDAARAALLDLVRRVFLVEPAAAVPSERFLPRAARDADTALRARLVAPGAYTWPAGAALAPKLAIALDRVAACRHALGQTAAWPVLRAQDATGGSRYELGLGVDLAPPSAAELDALAAARTSGAFAPGTPDDVLALLARTTPRSSTDDPHGAWLLGPCGLATIHPIAQGRTYVSHLALHGLVIGETITASRVLLAAAQNAPGDPGPDAVLLLALADADRDRQAAGLPAWTLLAGADETTAWQHAIAPPAPLVDAMHGADLGIPSDLVAVHGATSALPNVPNELVATLQLDAALAAGLAAHDPAAVQSLSRLVDAFQARGIAAVLPLWTDDNRVILVTAVTSLPGDATLLTGHLRSSLRWHVAPLTSTPGHVATLSRAVGSRNEATPGDGVDAVIVVAAGRSGTTDPRGRVDPASFAASLPAGRLIDLPAYERLMNLLERVRPLGVVVNTRGIRTHIDADGDGHAEPLSTRLSRTFRPFRQPRLVGEDHA